MAKRRLNSSFSTVEFYLPISKYISVHDSTKTDLNDTEKQGRSIALELSGDLT